MVVEAATLLVGFVSGKSFNVMPIAISKSPVPCCSVNGFVNIKYDNSNVTAFLAVVTCNQTNQRTKQQNQNPSMIIRFDIIKPEGLGGDVPWL